MPSRRDSRERSARRADGRSAAAGQACRHSRGKGALRRQPAGAARHGSGRTTVRRNNRSSSNVRVRLPRYHLVRGHFGAKEYERPYLCTLKECLRLHWTVGTGPARDRTIKWVPARTEDSASTAPKLWLVASKQAAELLTDLLDCSSTFVDGLADAFGLDNAARDSARQIKTWPQMKEMLERQGVIGTQDPIRQRGLFWETIQGLINKETRELEREPAVDLRGLITSDK